MAKVTTIPATKNKFTALPTNALTRRRVAGYARVSTDSDEQFTSYKAQVNYYTDYIKSRTDWEFVKVYTDEGISALGTKHRDGFKKMIADALAGKIDLIVTKSVSRFARNTVDSLVTIRKLKEKGVECFFEKENIYTFDGKGELLLTIMSSLAQEESRSISENVTWGQRKRFADGKVSVAYSNFLGFEKGENDTLKVVPEEAETVRIIYKLFLEGKTTHGITNFLMEHGVLSPAGKKTWRASTIASILTNEKYKGDALLQKRFTADFLTKELRINNGEVPQYYAEGSHEAISRRNLNWCRMKWHGARNSEELTVTKLFTANSSVAIAVDSMVVRSGTPRMSTEVSYFNAITSSRMKSNVPRPGSPRTRLRNGFLLPTIS